MPFNPQAKALLGCCSACPFFVALLVTLASFATPATLAQSQGSIKGVVTTKDNRPVAGVSVVSSKYKETTTDKEGRFRIEHPGAVIHFWKEGLQPRAFVIGPGTDEIHVTMDSSTANLVAPVCGKPQEGQEQIGWGRYGLQFKVPRHAVKMLGGKPDVDYVRYVIKPKDGEAYLELWFGLYAMNMLPDDGKFTDSANFEQRNVADSNGRVIGVDSWGNLRSGASWRQTAVGGQGGARYQDAPPREASLFDEIVDSLCLVPYPPH